jgi:hypothetical protein
VARVKGTAVLQLVKAAHALGEPARRALGPELQKYLQERILVNSWYPEHEYIAVMAAVAGVWPTPKGQTVWELFGRSAAQHDLSTIYKGMLRGGGTLLGALKAARDLFGLYHDTGRVEISGDEERAYFDLFDYAGVHAGHCQFLDAYLCEHLRMSTGREYIVREAPCRARGGDRCRREFAPRSPARPR